MPGRAGRPDRNRRSGAAKRRPTGTTAALPHCQPSAVIETDVCHCKAEHSPCVWARTYRGFSDGIISRFHSGTEAARRADRSRWSLGSYFRQSLAICLRKSWWAVLGSCNGEGLVLRAPSRPRRIGEPDRTRAYSRAGITRPAVHQSERQNGLVPAFLPGPRFGQALKTGSGGKAPLEENQLCAPQ